MREIVREILREIVREILREIVREIGPQEMFGISFQLDLIRFWKCFWELLSELEATFIFHTFPPFQTAPGFTFLEKCYWAKVGIKFEPVLRLNKKLQQKSAGQICETVEDAKRLERVERGGQNLNFCIQENAATRFFLLNFY